MSKAPIIMGNAPSSGSSVLANIIGRIPGVFHAGEFSAFDKMAWLGLKGESLHASIPLIFDRGYRARYACEMVVAFTNADQYGLTREELRYRLSSASWEGDYAGFVDSILSERARDTNNTRWLEKTPANVFAFRLLNDLVEGVRFIQVVRDAGTTIASLERRGLSPSKAVARWYLSTLAGSAMWGKENYLMVRYEELLANPVAQLRRICDFIDEPFNRHMLEPSFERDTQDSVDSWAHSPTGALAPPTQALSPSNIEISATSAACMMRFRATARFYEDGNIPSALSPMELQELLGYKPVIPKRESDLGRAHIRFGLDQMDLFMRRARRGMTPPNATIRLERHNHS